MSPITLAPFVPRIDPLTGKQAIRAIRIVSDCPQDNKTGLHRVPVGNLLGSLTIRLPDALQSTVQSTLFELRIGVRIDGVDVPVSVEAEHFSIELQYEDPA